jgi:hypothetical protein
MIAHFEPDLLVLAPPSHPASPVAQPPPGLLPDPEPEGRQWLTWKADAAGVLFLLDVAAGVVGAVIDATPAELEEVKASPGKPWIGTSRVFVRSWPVTSEEQAAVLVDDPTPEARAWHRWRVSELEGMVYLIDMRSGTMGIVCGASAEEVAEVREKPFTPWPDASRVRLQKQN